jgi:TP901 family phage tail tape measure protein
VAEQVGAIFYEVTLETGEMVRKSRTVSKELDGLESGFTRVAAAVGVLVSSLAIAGVMQRAINSARTFEKQLADLSAITGVTGDGLKSLSREAKDLASTSTASAGEVVEAMKFIAGAKSELLETQGALAAVTKEAIALSEAAGIALPDAANAVVLSLNQFGAGADQAARFVNVLAAGAKEGSSEVADTTMALKNAGVTASGAGVSFEEANAALQTLAKSGVKGAEAGTALRNVILILETSADKKLKPSVNGLAGALENLRAKGLDATAMAELFGRENIDAGQALVRGTEVLKQFNERLTGTQTAYEQAAINSNTLDAAITKMNNALDLAAQRLGGELLPVTKGAADAIRDLALQFAEGSGVVKSATEALIQGVTVIGALLAGKVVAAVFTFLAALRQVVLVSGAATIAAQAGAIAMRGFATALAFIGGPITVAIAALTLLALNWDKLTGATKTAAEVAENSAQRIATALSQGGKIATRELTKQLEDAQATLARLDREIKDGSVLSIYGDEQGRTPVIGRENLARLKSERTEVAKVVGDIQTALANAYGTGRRPANAGGGQIRYTGTTAEEDAAAAAAAAKKRSEEEAKTADQRAKDYADSLMKQQAIEDEARELGNKAVMDDAKKREQAEKDRAIAVAMARDLAALNDPAAQVRLDSERKLAALDEALGAEQLLMSEYAEARVALEANTAQRLRDIEEDALKKRQAAQSMQLQGFESLFGSMAEVQKTFAGEQDGTYKALFAASKAFAIADSIIKIQQGIASAASLPFPANLGAMATVAAQTAGIVSTIKGANYGGGRQYGGPTSAGSLYRVNETGAPEMFTAANGNQYMLPTQNGSVTPADSVGGGNVVHVYNTYHFNGDTFSKADTIALIERGGQATQAAVLQTLERTRR